MTDKELRKLKRSDLIEILYYLSRENDELKEQNRALTERLDRLVDQAAAQSADMHRENRPQKPGKSGKRNSGEGA